MKATENPPGKPKPEAPPKPKTSKDTPPPKDEVDEAGEESFPASDAPPWT